MDFSTSSAVYSSTFLGARTGMCRRRADEAGTDVQAPWFIRCCNPTAAVSSRVVQGLMDGVGLVRMGCRRSDNDYLWHFDVSPPCSILPLSSLCPRARCRWSEMSCVRGPSTLGLRFAASLPISATLCKARIIECAALGHIIRRV